MGFAFPWPYSFGEWLAWSSAVITIMFGLVLLFAPVTGLRLLHLQTLPDHPEAVASARGTAAGFYLGVGISCVLLAQPLLYIALGLSWSLTALGRLVSVLSDNGGTAYNWIAFAVELALGLMALLFALGIVV